MTDLTGAVWRKSTRSGGNGGECVEVATNLTGVVAVRDSKDQSGASLTFPPVAWGEFVRQINSGTFVDGGRTQQRGLRDE